MGAGSPSLAPGAAGQFRRCNGLDVGGVGLRGSIGLLSLKRLDAAQGLILFWPVARSKMQRLMQELGPQFQTRSDLAQHWVLQ